MSWYMDPTYFIFVLPALILALYAQWRVQSAYNKWLRVRNARGLTGLQTAKMLLNANNLSHISIEGTPGMLSDHYEPRTKTMRLSRQVAQSDSVAAVAVVAHEIGHATQNADAYLPLKLHTVIAPGVQIGSRLGLILIVIGLILEISMGLTFGYHPKIPSNLPGLPDLAGFRKNGFLTNL